MKKFQKQLKELKNEDVLQARPSWVLENKQLLMSQISKTRVEVYVENKKEKTLSESWRSFSHIYQMFVPTNINKAFRPVLTAFMALVITTGGWVASAYAEPGDFMWSTKVAINSVVEQSKLALTAEENKTSVKLEFASKRAQILRQVSDSDITNKDIKNKLLKETSADLKNQLDNVNDSLQKSDANDVSKLVKEVSLKTIGISKTLKEVAEKTAEDNVALSNVLSKQATDTSKQSLEMVEVVLEKKAEVKSEVSEEEKMIIKEHIAGVVNEIKEDTKKVQEQASQLKDVKNSGTAESVGEDAGVEAKNSVTTTSSTVVETVTTISIKDSIATKEITDNNTLSTKVDGIVKNIDVTNSDVTKLLDSNVLEAVKKTLELKNTVTDVSQELKDSLLLQTQNNTTNSVNIVVSKVVASSTVSTTVR